MSGTIVGRPPQLASAASARIAVILEIMSRFGYRVGRSAMVRECAAGVCAVSNLRAALLQNLRGIAQREGRIATPAVASFVLNAS